MNSPRGISDSDYYADSDATYCSAAEITYLEGRSNECEISIKKIDPLKDKEQTQKKCISHEQPLIDFNQEQDIHEKIIPDSDSEQCSNLQPVGLKHMTNPIKTGANTRADKVNDESEDIIPIFQSTLSFPKHSNMPEHNKNHSLQGTLPTPKDLPKKMYLKKYQLLSNSAPVESPHERDQHVGETEFHSAPSSLNTQSATKVIPVRAKPKKILLENHRLKIKTHCQTLTSRIYDIKNEVSLCIIGCGPKLQKTKVMALFEEVKVLRNILSQLFHASKRLISYIGGKAPLKSTEYLTADQACEKLLVQLNPETYREDFTPLREKYDSDQEGYQVTDVKPSSQNGENENPEIMDIQEENSSPFAAKISKNVRFQSPLANMASLTYTEAFHSSCRVGRVNERQNVIPHPSALKKTDSQSRDSSLQEKLDSSAHSEDSLLHEDNTTFTCILNDRPQILANQNDKDANVHEEAHNIQKVGNSRDTSLHTAHIFVSDDGIRVMGEHSEVSSSDREQPSIYDEHFTTMINISSISTPRVQATLPTESTSSPKMIITDAVSSLINRKSQPQLHSNRNNNRGSPKVDKSKLINLHHIIKTTDDPSTFKKDTNSTLKRIQCQCRECRNSGGMYLSQVPTHSLNHNTIVLGPEKTKECATSLMSSQVNQQRNIRNISPPRVETWSHINKAIDTPDIIDNDKIAQNNEWIGQSLQHNSLMLDELTPEDCTQESEITSKCQTQSSEVDCQGTSLTYYEPPKKQRAQNSRNINPVQEKVTDPGAASQFITQSSESSDIDMQYMLFDGFSSDEENQMVCIQPFSESTNISSSESSNRSTQSHPHGSASISKQDFCLKESTRTSDISMKNKHGQLPKEIREPMFLISEPSNNIQPPGWCNIFEQHKQKKTLPTLTELMIAGMISPGEMVLSLKGSRGKATLLKNAKILTSEGATFHSPMAWCSAWHEGKTVSRTLAYHRVYYNGVTLMDICQKAFKIAVEEMASATNERKKNIWQQEKKREHMAYVPVVINEEAIEIQDLHIMATSGNEVVKKLEGDAPKDIIMAIQSLFVHNYDEYTDESYESDFWDNGVLPVEKFHLIDQW